MDDLISRKAVLEQTYNWSKDEFLRVTNPFDHLRKRINSLLPVNPQEQKTGHWIRRIVDSGYNANWKCSECGYKEMTDFPTRYCPSCGAKMGVQNDKRRRT